MANVHNDGQHDFSRERPSDFGRAFSEWELPGRGWTLYDRTVAPEPRLRKFSYSPEHHVSIDDARMPSLAGRLFASRRPDRLLVYNPEEPDHEPQMPIACPTVLTESFRLIIPSEMKVSTDQTEQIIANLANSTSFISFEIVGTSDSIVFQFTCPASEKEAVSGLLKNHLPGVNFQVGNDALTEHVRVGRTSLIEQSIMADFGLGRQWFIPLPPGKSFATDPLLPLIASFEDLKAGETICVQVMMQRTRQRWQYVATNAIFDRDGKLRFSDLQYALPFIKEKLSKPIFAVNTRLFAQSGSKARSEQMARRASSFFRQFSSAGGNELIPLRNESGLDPNRHLLSFLDRTTFRSGALLSASEISGIVHLPTDSVRSPKLHRSDNRTKAAPEFATVGELVLGENVHLGQTLEIALPPKQRVKHMHLIGATGSGKSTAMLNMIGQDLKQGSGIAVVDPHGDTIDKVIERIPQNRIKDVIFIDPADEDYPVGFNILSAHSELEKTLLSSDLVAIFRRFSTSWGDQMNSVLANAILAFLESSRGGNLIDLKRFLIEKSFREEFLTTVEDDEIRYYWQKEFPELKGKPHASLLTRLDTFLRSKLIRYMVAQNENRLDFRRMMDEKKILLIRLSLGAIGEENAYLLGSLIVSKLHQAVLSRQDIAEEDRNPFYLYIDEAQHFLTPSMNQILSGTRKYKLGLVLAHQQLNQFHSGDADILSSVLSNCYARICFRLDDADAERMARGFSFFTSEHLKDLGVGEAICRFEQSRYDFNLKTPLLELVPSDVAQSRRNAVVEFSRKTYARPKEVVAEELKTHHADKPTSREAKEMIPKPISPESPAAKDPPYRRQAIHDRGREGEKPLLKPEVIEPAYGETREHKNDEFPDRSSTQHRYLQSLIKRIGEKHEFVATIEKEVFGGMGRIDVALENKDLKIACEIAVTNTAAYERQNIQKCLSAGYDRVVVISTDTKHLQDIKRGAVSLLNSDQSERVHFLEPENFHLFLQSLQPETPPAEQTVLQRVKGYKVDSTFAQSHRHEAEAVRERIIEILSQASGNEAGGRK